MTKNQDISPSRKDNAYYRRRYYKWWKFSWSSEHLKLGPVTFCWFPADGFEIWLLCRWRLYGAKG